MKAPVKQRLASWVLSFWHRKTLLSYGLSPLACLFRLITFVRYHYYQIKGQVKAKMPVIIVGNITVGGTGKTPLVAHIGNYLQTQGFKPAILMHGYASQLAKGQTMLVSPSSGAAMVGDEALLMAKKCSALPVVATRSRAKAFSYVQTHFPEVNVMICDDGLQHYAIARDIEIAVIDGHRRFGNGFCLPVGPCRETPKRLKRVDFVVSNAVKMENAYLMRSELTNAVIALNGVAGTLEDFVGKKVHAVAGIGHPMRFFNMLRAQGIDVIEHAFADHHHFEPQDFAFVDKHPILMTEKDAVKCCHLNLNDAYAVPLTVKIEQEFMEKLLRRLRRGQKATRHSGLPHLQTTPSV